jgi:PelA/Pel-15E family pectate lyase
MKAAASFGFMDHPETLARFRIIPILIAMLFVMMNATGKAQPVEHIRWSAALQQPVRWYGSEDAIRIADNLLLYQFPSGGWPKNIDMAQNLSDGAKRELRAINHLDSATIDNSATYTQLRYLAKVYRETKLDRFRAAFLRGFDYLIQAQYANGGWPQFYPLRKGYYSHITFNDDAMIGVMELLRDASRGGEDFGFLDEVRIGKATNAVTKGIECILKCQIHVHGVLTAWCAQHDERDFSPAKARAYELPSLSGEETVGIIEFLMEMKNPGPEIITSVQAAVKWLSTVKIHGIRMVEIPDAKRTEGRDRVVKKDPSAPPMWARFYELGTNRPFFCSRDGIKRFDLSEISSERRNHYSWLGYWPQPLLDKKYPKWANRHSVRNAVE